MYISNASGITYFEGRLYDLAASQSYVLKLPATKNSPEREKTFYPPTQELLGWLYSIGHSGITKQEIEVVSSAKRIVKIKEEEE